MSTTAASRSRRIIAISPAVQRALARRSRTLAQLTAAIWLRQHGRGPITRQERKEATRLIEIVEAAFTLGYRERQQLTARQRGFARPIEASTGGMH